jgi:hypothetical protein
VVDIYKDARENTTKGSTAGAGLISTHYIHSSLLQQNISNNHIEQCFLNEVETIGHIPYYTAFIVASPAGVIRTTRGNIPPEI